MLYYNYRKGNKNERRNAMDIITAIANLIASIISLTAAIIAYKLANKKK